LKALDVLKVGEENKHLAQLRRSISGSGGINIPKAKEWL
jgi:hypothetical protein